MQAIKSDESRANCYLHQVRQEEESNEESNKKVLQGQKGDASPISHRKCDSEFVAGTSSLQDATALPDMPSVSLTSKFYEPRDQEPIFFESQLMTHRDFREILSKHMKVYAVVTDEVSFTGHFSCNGGVRIYVFGKPNFKVNDVKRTFSTDAFKVIPYLAESGESPFSSDLIGFSVRLIDSIIWDLYKKHKKLAATSNKKLIDESIFKKLDSHYSNLQQSCLNCECHGVSSHKGFRKDFVKVMSPQDARYIFKQVVDESIEKIKEEQGYYTLSSNCLNSKATIDDLREILSIYMHWGDNDHSELGFLNDCWRLNYLDDALLSNAKWHESVSSQPRNQSEKKGDAIDTTIRQRTSWKSLFCLE